LAAKFWGGRVNNRPQFILIPLATKIKNELTYGARHISLMQEEIRNDYLETAGNKNFRSQLGVSKSFFMFGG